MATSLAKVLKEFQEKKSIEEIKEQHASEVRERERDNIDARAKHRRLVHRLHAERQEAEVEESIYRGQETKCLLQVQYEQEEKLAQELAACREKEIVEIKLRQRQRATSIELRDLEAKLRAAYVTKELAAQIREKQLSKLQEDVHEREADAALCNQRRADHLYALEMERQLKEGQGKYRAELQDQMILDEQRRQVSFQEQLHEKKLLDDITKVILEEDQRDFEDKMCKQRKTKQEMEESQKMKTIWKEREKEQLEEENRNLQGFLEQQLSLEKQRMEAQREREEMKAYVKETLGQKMHKAELEAREREALMMELQAEEHREAVEKKEKEQHERELRTRVELRRAAVQQLAEKMERLKYEAKQDAAYKQELMRQYAESDRVEQMTAQKRRMRTLEHGRLVEQQLEQRRLDRALEMQQLIGLHRQEEEEERERLRLVEEERLYLLKQHANNLIGYIPPGVLRESDLQALGSAFVEKYAKPPRK